MEPAKICMPKNEKLEISKVDIEIFLQLGEQKFKLQVGKSSSGDTISMIIDHEENLSMYYYGLKMSVDEFFKLGKTFRQCDTCEEIINFLKAIINNFESNKNGFKLSLEQKDKSTMNLLIESTLLSGYKETLNLVFSGMEKDKDKLIEYLLGYINDLKKKTNVTSLKENNIISNIQFPINLSKIIKDCEKIKFVEESIKQKEGKNFKYSLIFESSRDGDKAKKFHELCDNNAPILVIIKTIKNVVFGGYTTHVLNSTSGRCKDDKAFCFNLDKKKIYNVKKGEDVLCLCSNCLHFYNGNGNMMCINDSFFTSSNGTCQSSTSGFEGMEIDYEINNGEQNFQVSQLEVYKIDLNKE